MTMEKQTMRPDLGLLTQTELVVTSVGLALRGFERTLEAAGFPALTARGPASGGSLGTLLALNRSARSSLNRNRNRNRNRNQNRTMSPVVNNGGLALEPWRERATLYTIAKRWIDLPIDLPPAPMQLQAEAIDLLRKQALLHGPAESLRRDEIILQSQLELSAYLRPLGIEELGGYDATVSLVYLVCLLCDEIGLRYKTRFNTPRPNQVEPRLRPMLPNPPHASYPSNHSFQSFAVAFVLSRIIPEHPASSELFQRARRVAENREWAGVHYASDTRAGHDLARMVMPVLEEVCREQMLAAQKEWI